MHVCEHVCVIRVCMCVGMLCYTCLPTSVWAHVCFLRLHVCGHVCVLRVCEGMGTCVGTCVSECVCVLHMHVEAGS